MKTNKNQEFIVAGVAGLVGIFLIALSWSEFMGVAKEHPAVSLFVLGFGQLVMAYGFWTTGLSKRSFVKQMEQLKDAYGAGEQARRESV